MRKPSNELRFLAEKLNLAKDRGDADQVRDLNLRMMRAVKADYYERKRKGLVEPPRKQRTFALVDLKRRNKVSIPSQK